MIKPQHSSVAMICVGYKDRGRGLPFVVGDVVMMCVLWSAPPELTVFFPQHGLAFGTQTLPVENVFSLSTAVAPSLGQNAFHHNAMPPLGMFIFIYLRECADSGDAGPDARFDLAAAL